ncbi:cyanoexosortase A system-associated protein [Candidatus Gracilibacteria bacterium]|nr:cyanoexosortase A system-associated protein [Candidatus Gracilibacteria bacterium]NJM85841.1 cyanoexosortase A system-associated protein [Hydrococcus sp. RU_2_2]NJP17900.1 cyanoexosortase A system-associated protein [Hydrococcus sp. CRU_1_1]
MFVWKQLRIPVLALTFCSAIFVLGKSLLVSPTEQVIHTTFVFPAEVPLPGWKIKGSQTLQAKQTKEGTFEEKRYEYTRNGLTVAIAMRYVDHPHTNEKLFREYDPTLLPAKESASIVREQKETGFYSLSVREDFAHLRACINPRGQGAIAYTQFIENRYTYDLQVNRLLPILLGSEPLRDHRCLWTHLSIPLKETPREQAYQILEQVWVSWYQWWHPRFPSL